MSERAHLILSLDYEVFGNGSGDLDCCVLQPTERIAAIAERHGARLAIFVDALEFAAMERTGVSDAHRVRQQLQSLLARGHRVELHLHPQWTDQARLQDGRWQLDLGRWRIGDLPADDVAAIMASGNRWLVALADSVAPGLRPTAFRAGGWCIQPARAVLAAMTAAGLRIESSVAPGMRQWGRAHWFDFRTAPPLPLWPIENDVCQVAPGGPLWEAPIAVGSLPRALHLRQARANRGRLAEGCCGAYEGGGGRLQRVLALAGKLAALGKAMLDYSVWDGPTLVALSQHWLLQHGHHQAAALPLVAIGHSKNFSSASAQALDHYLAWASRQPLLHFSSYAALQLAIDTHHEPA